MVGADPTTRPQRGRGDVAAAPLDAIACYRWGVRTTHAWAQGSDELAALLAHSSESEVASLPGFARAQNVREWFAPAVFDPAVARYLPAEFSAALTELSNAQPSRLQALRDMVNEVDHALQESGVGCLFLKGLQVAQCYYPDPARRHQYDIDVLVRPVDLDSAIRILERLGFDAETPQAKADLRKVNRRSLIRSSAAVTLRRADGMEVDLHARTKSAKFPRIDEDAFWRDAQGLEVDGHMLKVLSEERLLMLLLVSLGLDLGRGASRAKHFLDLYLMARAFGPRHDWGALLERWTHEGVERVAATVLCVFLDLWQCGEEFPGLIEALAARRAWIALSDAREPERLVTQPRESRDHRAWLLALRRPATLDEWRRVLTAQLPAVIRRRRRASRLSGWTLAQGLAHAVSPSLPAELARLLSTRRMRAVDAQEITFLATPSGTRRTLRIRLADGRQVKGRLHGASAIERMKRYLPLLTSCSFPQLLATSTHASLEAWCEGSPASQAEAATSAAAGALLAQVHAAMPQQQLAAESDLLAAWRTRALAQCELLERAGHLSSLLAQRVQRELEAQAPLRATQGLRHGDFCLENFVLAGGALWCVDNTTVGPGLLESDLAQTVYRWPMPPPQREAFFGGYGASEALSSFLERERYWMMSALLLALAWRHEHGIDGLDRPLALLIAQCG